MKRNFNLYHLAFILVTCSLLFTGCKKEPAEESTTVTDYDGNVYNIIKIGDQEWMDRNLDVTHYRNGEVILNSLTTANEEGGWSDYDNNPSYGDAYGKLYNSYAVHDTRGLAPEGWHVATYDDWMTLISSLGGFEVAGGILKETGTTHWNDPNTGATDAYGFKALPGGYGTSTFSYMGTYGGFWTSTRLENRPEETHMFWFYYNNPTIEHDSSTPMGISVRCIKD